MTAKKVNGQEVWNVGGPYMTRVVRTVVVLRVDHIGRRARLRMQELGLRTTDVARRMGVRRQRVSNLLNFERMSEDAFARLTKALEWHESDWLTPLPGTEVHRQSDARRDVRAEAKKIAKELAEQINQS